MKERDNAYNSAGLRLHKIFFIWVLNFAVLTALWHGSERNLLELRGKDFISV